MGVRDAGSSAGPGAGREWVRLVNRARAVTLTGRVLGCLSNNRAAADELPRSIWIGFSFVMEIRILITHTRKIEIADRELCEKPDSNDPPTTRQASFVRAVFHGLQSAISVREIQSRVTRSFFLGCNW